VFSASAIYRAPVTSEPAADVDAIEFVLALARALHRYGTPAHRLEEALGVCCARLGLRAEVFSTPTTIIMSFGEPAELRSRMMRVEGGELDMGKLGQVDQLADAVANHKVTAADGVDQLAAIIAAPKRFGHGVSTLMHGVTAGSLAVFFGGGLEDVGLAAAIGLSLGLLAQYAKRSTDQARVFELVGSAFAAFMAALVSAWWPGINPSVVTVAALIVLLPGMSLTVAMIELATRNLISGTARLMSAVIVLLQLVVGVALGEQLAGALVEVHQAVPVGLPEWAPWAALVASSLGMSIVVQARPSAFGWILAACVTGYIGSRAGTEWLGGTAYGALGVTVGAFAAAVLSNAFARIFQRPAQIVLVPAVLTLVPGAMGLRGMASLLDHDTLTGVETVFAMFVVAIGIVAGLLIANAVVSPRRSL
jgi:uncharacterized membrane protein YjjP (DUF1212 family)